MMALELEMVGLVLDAWPGFIVKDRDMQLLWDIYRQPQVALVISLEIPLSRL